MHRNVPQLWFEPVPWIDGKPIDRKPTEQVVNPATGQLIARVAFAESTDIEQAIASSHGAQDRWQKTSAFERGEILKRVAERLEAQRDVLARLLTAEQGKPYLQALGEVDYAASFFRWFGEEARRVCGRIAPHPQADREFLVEHKPLGLAAWITPWNFPLAQGAKKIAAALAAGCCGIWKPAESTPLIALAMAPIFEQAGLPSGAVQILPGLGSQLGSILSNHPAIRVVSLTGSVRTGREILRDADLDFTVDQLVRLKLFVSGQVCVTANRIFVHRDIRSAFMDKLLTRLAASKIGDGLEDGVDAGPLIHQQACQGVDMLVQKACQMGARIVGLNASYASDSRLARGSFYPATVIDGVTDQMDLFGCEIFGPIFAILEYSQFEDVILRANSVTQGLAGYVYGQDLSECKRVARRLQVGIVGINEWRPLKAEIPFGGVKQSGLGVEGGKEGIYDYLSLQVISTPRD